MKKPDTAIMSSEWFPRNIICCTTIEKRFRLAGNFRITCQEKRPKRPRVDNLIQDPGAHRADLLCQPIHRVTPRSSARGGAG